MFLAKTPEVIKPFAKDFIWNLSRKEPVIYLTFDDGPQPGVTDAVLDILASFDAVATFFCVGGNVQSHRDLYAQLSAGGHAVGNHTWNHMNGREFSDFSYLKNVLLCAEVVDSTLFRPPYGLMRRSQAQALKQRFHMVMWDVIIGDWRADYSPERCLKNAVDNVQNGSIVVFHDSVKAKKNVLYTLPLALEHWKKQGFSFAVIPGMDSRPR